MKSVLDFALDFARRGWQVFPVEHKGKRPATLHGLNDATVDAEQIQAWFGNGRLYNIAIRTGGGSGFDVLDVDGDEGDKSLQALIAVYGKLPETPCVQTGGGGRHFFFKHAEGVRNSASVVGNKIDVRGDGGYVVAPPSIHANGNEYRWLTPPDTPLAEWPPWLLARMKAESRKTEPAHTEPAAGTIAAGQRNTELTRLAGAMRRRGFDAVAIEAALQRHNIAHCSPPLSADEIRRIAQSVGRYEPATTTGEKSRVLRRRCLADVTPKTIEYLIPEVLPMGKVVSLISQEGDGKSTLSGYLASVVSRGGHWPTGGTVPAGDVVIFSHEESPEHSIAPRLIANGGELGRIHLAESVIEADGQETEFDIERDIQTLDDWADELPDLRLVIFDPITSYVSCNENSNSEVRRALKPLIDFAERRNVCVLALSHLSKKIDLKMINRTLGSRAWSAVPRMVWALQVETAEDEDGHKVDTGRRFLLCVKCNLGRKPQGLRFAIEDSGAVVFDTERFSRNVDQDGGAEPSRASEIGRWLTDRIGVDVVPASEITKDGCERWGISKRRLGEIATKAGINKRFSVAEGCWVWTVKR